MDKENVMPKCFVDGLKMIKNGIDLILSANEVKPVEMTKEIPFDDSYNKIAIRVAETYNTFHPEWGVQRLYKDIVKMADDNSKVGILVNWMRKKGIDGFENFFRLTKDKQQVAIHNAVTENMTDVITILNNRFGK